MYVAFVLMSTGGLLVTANAGPMARSWGFSAAALTLAATLSPLANGASRVFWGWASDRLGRENTMVFTFTLQALFLYLVVAIGQQSAALFAFTLVLVYFTWGEIYSLFPATSADYFGTRNATSNYGVLYTAKGVASIIGGWVAAIFRTVRQLDDGLLRLRGDVAGGSGDCRGPARRAPGGAGARGTGAGRGAGQIDAAPFDASHPPNTECAQPQVEQQRHHVGGGEDERPGGNARIDLERADERWQQHAEEAGRDHRRRNRAADHQRAHQVAPPRQHDRRHDGRRADAQQDRRARLSPQRRARCGRGSSESSDRLCSVSVADCMLTLSASASTIGMKSASTTMCSSSASNRAAMTAHSSPPPMFESSQGKRSRNAVHGVRIAVACTPSSWKISS